MPSFDQFSSTNLGLSYIAPAQAQKHVTVNESFRLLDAVVQLSVIDKDLTAPPVTPNDGDRYIVSPNPSGDWANQNNNIAAYQDGTWAYYTPLAGWITYVQDENINYQFNGTAWVEISSGGVNNGDDATFGQLGIGGATADATNVLSVNSAAALFNNVGNGVQLKLNKNAVADTASFLFKTGFSGRAEIGLTGDNEFHFKVSIDGSTWAEALTLNTSSAVFGGHVIVPTGSVSITGSASNPLYIANDGAPYIEIRDTVNTTRGFLQAQDGIINFGSISNHPFRILTNNTEQMRILSSGLVGIGTSVPTAKLEVAGAVKFGSYAVASLPSASGNGAGSLIYVSDETGGGVMAFSDGTDWRRVTDRAVVS